MRNLLFLFVFFFLPSFVFSQSVNDIKIDKSNYDLGLIKEKDGIVNHSYLITNTANIPLIISKLETSCGCTTTKWKMKPILPGKSTIIRLFFDPKNRPGNFNKTLRIICNFKPGFVIVSLNGFVVPKKRTFLDDYPYEFPSGLRFQYPYISFGKIIKNETKQVSVEFVNNNNQIIRPIFIFLPKGINIIKKEKCIKPQTISKISFSINTNKISNYGINILKFKYKINNMLFEHDFRVNILENFSHLSALERKNAPNIFFKKKMFKVKNIKEEYKLRIYNSGNSNLVIRRVYSKESIILSLNSSTIKPNTYAVLSIKISDMNTSKKRILIRIISNDFKHPESKIRLRLQQ